MKTIRTPYLQDVIELIDKNNPHTIIIRDKEYVQVIRCKDCKWFAINGIEGATLNGKPLRYAVCTHYHGMRGITAYSFCSKAEGGVD